MTDSDTASGAIRTLDHVGVVSADAEKLWPAYERMGFLLTPPTQQTGSPAPGEPPELLGTGNRCAMFMDGYLELLAIVDPARPTRGFPERLARYAGLHILAFGCDDADAAGAAMAARGAGVAGIAHLERTVDTPHGPELARFSVIRPAPAEAPECHLNVLQHHTPAALWQPRYLIHPNGAQALAAATLCVADPERAAARYGRLLGHDPQRQGPGWRLRPGRGVLDVVGPETMFFLFGTEAPVLPFVAAFAVRVDSLATVEAILLANGVPFAVLDGRICTDPAAGGGAVCVFQED
ncbi:MAG: VOC family protein [Hyphomicrobiales bacterium]|nr:VOC family protein [Hyphomicrobiales bacterium]